MGKEQHHRKPERIPGTRRREIPLSMAHSLGLGLQIMDVFSMPSVEPEVKDLLAIPTSMKIAVAARLGYPIATPGHYLRVRRKVEEFTHQNRFGNMALD